MSADPDQPDPTRRAAAVLLPLVAAAGLWITGALARSLWIDEFHSLQHARQPTLGAFFASVADDNHPPLAWLILRGALALFGDGELALRIPFVAIGVALVAQTMRVVRHVPDPLARRVAPWLVVLSSYTFMIATEARMYGLLALATLGLVGAALNAFAGRRGAWEAAAWIAVGLHSHYYFAHDLVVIALTVATLALANPRWRPGARRLILPAILGGLAFLPWALTGFAEQIAHDLPSGAWSGRYSNAIGFVTSLAHLAFMNASLGGAWMSQWIAVPGSVVALVVGGFGLHRSWSRAEFRHVPVLPVVLAVGIGVPLWALLVSLVYERAGYNWRYIAGSVAPVMILLACGVRFRPLSRAVLSWLLIGSMAFVTAVSALSPGQEDYRGAVRHIVERAAPTDAVITRPQHFVNPSEALTGWDYYAPRVAADRGVAVDDLPTAYDQGAVDRALAHDRVWLFVRRRFSEAAFAKLVAAYPTHERVAIGNVLTVHRFER